MAAVKVLSTRKTHTVPVAPVAAQVRHDNYLWKAAAQQLFQLNKQDAFAFAAFIDSWGPGPDHLDSGQWQTAFRMCLSIRDPVQQRAEEATGERIIILPAHDTVGGAEIATNPMHRLLHSKNNTGKAMVPWPCVSV